MQTCDNCNNPNSTFCELENKKKFGFCGNWCMMQKSSRKISDITTDESRQKAKEKIALWEKEKGRQLI